MFSLNLAARTQRFASGHKQETASMHLILQVTVAPVVWRNLKLGSSTASLPGEWKHVSNLVPQQGTSQWPFCLSKICIMTKQFEHNPSRSYGAVVSVSFASLPVLTWDANCLIPLAVILFLPYVFVINPTALSSSPRLLPSSSAFALSYTWQWIRLAYLHGATAFIAKIMRLNRERELCTDLMQLPRDIITGYEERKKDKRNCGESNDRLHFARERFSARFEGSQAMPTCLFRIGYRVWEVYKVKRWEVDFVMSRGKKLIRGVTVSDRNLYVVTFEGLNWSQILIYHSER